jgi:hypothetical protein
VLGSLALRPRTALRSPHLKQRSYDRLREYQWVDAPLPRPLNGLVRWMLWQGGIRRESSPPRLHNAITEYLWRQSTWLDTHAEMVAAVRQLACPGATTHILGDYASVPLIALDAGVPVKDHDVDTTGQRLRAGYGTTASFARGAFDRSRHVLVLLRTGGSGLSADRSFRGDVARHLPIAGTFRTRDGVEHTLHGRPCGS